jgi:hypothetical protein
MKGTDGYCSQTKCGSLEIDILSGMAHLNVDIPLPSSAISPKCPFIFSANDYIHRGLMYEFLI